MHSIRRMSLAIVVLAFLVGIGSLFVPAPASVPAAAFHGQFLGIGMVTVLFIGSALLLLSGLRGFTAQFKLGYVMLCSGFILFGLGFLQIPVLMLMVDNIINLKWVSSGGVALPFSGGVLLMYLGTRTYARLFRVRGWSTSIIFALMVALASVVLMVLLPHAPWHGQAEKVFDGTVGPATFNCVLVTIAGWLAYRAAKNASVQYAEPLRLLAYGVIAATVGSGIQVAAGMLITNGVERVTNGIMVAPLVVAGFLWVAAAVAFNKIRFSEQEAVPEPAAAQTPPAASSDRAVLDAVIYLAGLASSTDAIDPILDEVRGATSQLGPNEPLSSAAQARLTDAYRRLEAYLTDQDPVRRYSLAELRTMAAHHLGGELTGSAFWRDLTRTS